MTLFSMSLTEVTKLTNVFVFDVALDMVKSLQEQKVLDDYPCAYNYMGKVSDVLPLLPDTLLGHRVWTWNNWQLPLDLTYGNWRKPLKSVADWIVPAFHGPSVHPIKVAPRRFLSIVFSRPVFRSSAA